MMKHIQDEIIEEFAVFEDWMDKYEYIIDMGKELSPITEDKKTEDKLVKGCQSRVWLDAKLEDGKIKFEADSDAIISKGLIALLVRVMNNQPPAEILNSELYFIDKIGLKEHLSPNRSNGLASMVKKMKSYAIAYNSILQNS